MSNRISLVQSAKIASPCPASWDQMEGDDKKRFCFQCRKHVYDFSKMKTAEVEDLLKSENVCGRIWRRADGHIITADCPVGIKKRRERIVMWFARAATFLACVGATGLTRIGLKRGQPEVGQRYFFPADISQREGVEHLSKWQRLQSDVVVAAGAVVMPPLKK